MEDVWLLPLGERTGNHTVLLGESLHFTSSKRPTLQISKLVSVRGFCIPWADGKGDEWPSIGLVLRGLYIEWEVDRRHVQSSLAETTGAGERF